MILKVHSDSSYLNEPQARSRVGGHFYMGNKDTKPECYNGPILNISTIMKNVMSSAAEAEVGSLFNNCKEAVTIRTILEQLGHEQPATPVQVDNSTADGFANKKIKQQRSRTMDMRFYWIQDRVQQGQFHIYWAPANLNLADYFTKHHAPTHHRNMRHHYIHETNHIQFISTIRHDLRGCVKP